MRNFHRNLLAETEAGIHNLNTTFNPISNCTTLLSNCYLSNGHCICTSLSPPSKPSQSHLVSYIISAVCALGVAFLILSTCTILLRQRWGRRSRRNSDLRTARGLVLMGEDRDHHGGPVDHPIWHINTVGLPQSVINEITSFKYRKLGGMLTDGRRDAADCLVCLAEFQDGDDLRLLPKCCHAFHLECIDTWLLSHTNCPLCRAPIVNVSVNEPVDSDGGLRSGVSESEHGSTRVMNLVNENGSLCDGGTGEGSGGGESSEEGNRKSDYFAELRMEWGRIAEFVKSNRKPIRVLSDLSGNHRMMSGVTISSCGDVNHQQQQQAGIERSASLDVSSSAMSSSGFMVDVVCSEASSSCKQEKGVSHSDDVEKTVSSIGLTLQKPVAPSSPAVISMNRSLSSSSGKKCPFRGSKRHASILPL